jgi:hypothetical protein
MAGRQQPHLGRIESGDAYIEKSACHANPNLLRLYRQRLPAIDAQGDKSNGRAINKSRRWQDGA